MAYSPYITRRLFAIPRSSLRAKVGSIEIWGNYSVNEEPSEILFVIPSYFLGMFAANLCEIKSALKNSVQKKITEDSAKTTDTEVPKPPAIEPFELEFGHKGGWIDGKRCTMGVAADRTVRLKYGNNTTEIPMFSNVLILMRVRRRSTNIKSIFHIIHSIHLLLSGNFGYGSVSSYTQQGYPPIHEQYVVQRSLQSIHL